MDDPRNISPRGESHVARTNDHENSHAEYNEIGHNGDNQNYKVQNIVCFWVVGLCNGFGWTVMLSATYDILKRLDGVSVCF